MWGKYLIYICSTEQMEMFGLRMSSYIFGWDCMDGALGLWTYLVIRLMYLMHLREDLNRLFGWISWEKNSKWPLTHALVWEFTVANFSKLISEICWPKGITRIPDQIYDQLPSRIQKKCNQFFWIDNDPPRRSFFLRKFIQMAGSDSHLPGRLNLITMRCVENPVEVPD